jgi:DUF438 domain-containing protein
VAGHPQKKIERKNKMDELKMLRAILDAVPYPVVFFDTTHIIRYLNKRAKYHYYQERGYSELVGKSLLECHSEKSAEMIKKTVEKFRNHHYEVFLGVNVRNERTYIVPVRDEQGGLIGYYERFEKNLQK